MKVLILKNTLSEGPGTISDFLDERGLAYKVIELQYNNYSHLTDELYDCLIIMGGPMSVNDSEKIQYINFEIELVKKYINHKKKVLGICLGAQIIAKALGSEIYKGTQQEVGWYDIDFTDEGINDENFSQLLIGEKSGKVFQWHGETFDIPDNAVRLAGSILYENQAFKYGDAVYALQFHIEVSKNMIFKWLENDENMNKIQNDTDEFYKIYSEKAVKFYDFFLIN